MNKKGPIPVAQRVKKWRKNHPQRYRAHKMVERAKAKGEIIQKPCEVCGKEKSEGHHEDYSKPLDIIWLCREHHIEADKKRKEREKSLSTVSKQDQS